MPETVHPEVGAGGEMGAECGMWKGPGVPRGAGHTFPEAGAQGHGAARRCWETRAFSTWHEHSRVRGVTSPAVSS